MSQITKDADCPVCEDLTLEITFDPDVDDETITCDECGTEFDIDYDKATGTVTLVEFDDDDEDDDDDEESGILITDEEESAIDQEENA